MRKVPLGRKSPYSMFTGNSMPPSVLNRDERSYPKERVAYETAALGAAKFAAFPNQRKAAGNDKQTSPVPRLIRSSRDKDADPSKEPDFDSADVV